MQYRYTTARDRGGSGTPTIRRRSRRRRICRCVHPTTTTHCGVNDDHNTSRNDTLWKTTTVPYIIYHFEVFLGFGCNLPFIPRSALRIRFQQNENDVRNIEYRAVFNDIGTTTAQITTAMAFITIKHLNNIKSTTVFTL